MPLSIRSAVPSPAWRKPAPHSDEHPRRRGYTRPSDHLAADRKNSVLDATLVNGTASHALDYDDVSGVMGGHPSAMLIPSMIALGESLNSTGRDLALAYVVGYETECRIARGVHFHHYDKGWHPTATIGIFGTVAAASRLLHLTVPQTAVALGLAASLACGLKASFGTMTKPLHVGHASPQRDLRGLYGARRLYRQPGRVRA